MITSIQHFLENIYDFLENLNLRIVHKQLEQCLHEIFIYYESFF
jgi:hypothetical protein